ncbi:MAG: PDZ domain-containing protein [Candidatus Latescibacteria bacterium]|nr:PDZ domain-containing protein [Candidatus Latescibacterota bacterium]
MPLSFLIRVLLIFISTTTIQAKALDEFNTALRDLTQKVRPAVVQILVTSHSQRIGVLKGTEDTPHQQSTGSGVILDANGYIITNAHVVEGAQRIRVVLSASVKSPNKSILSTQSRTVGAQIIRIDRETDLAVIKVSETNLPTLSLGDSDALHQGQLVFAFGSPLGLENSVSMGVVSAIARQLQPEDPMIYIQTDATINPGNSGGPLVDVQGNVIGINTLIFSQSGGSEGIGFAAPSNIIRNIFQQIRDTGRVRRGDIGVFAQTITPLLAKALNLQQPWGVIISDVFPQSPAFLSGLQVGDVVLSLDGKTLENGRQFHVNLYNKPVDSTVTLEILRDKEIRQIQTKVSERDDDPNRFTDLVHPQRNKVARLGALGIDLDEKTAPLFPALRSSSGTVIAAISTGTPSWHGGLLPGDIIYALNGKNIQNLKHLNSLLKSLPPYAPIALQIERQARLQYLTFELE